MGAGVDYLEIAKEGLDQISGHLSDLDEAIKKGEQQAQTRDGVIQTINEMSDALQKASDEINSRLSGSVLEFNCLRDVQDESSLRGYFERTATTYSDPSLRLLLHEGGVCGQLHKVGDRFSQPFSPATASGVSFWEAVKIFFHVPIA